MDVKLSENGDNIIAQITNNLYYKILKDEDEQTKKLMVDYAKEHNAEIRFIDEEKVKLIIDLGCKEYFKNYQSGYISKDKIKKFIKDELPDDEIMECCGNYDINGVYIRKKLEEVLEENTNE